MMLSRLVSAVALSAFVILGSPVRASDALLDGPVTIIVPFEAGGGTDLIGRIFSSALAGKIGQPVVVENRGGAGTTIGTRYAARAAADGRVLLFNGSPLAYHPALFRTPLYDVTTDFIPISLISSQPYVLLVNNDYPADTVADLVELAKSDPNVIPYGSAGTGSGMHLSSELLFSTLEIGLLHIPYTGTGPALNDLMAGEIKVLLTTTAGAAEMVRAGSVKALAVTSLERVPSMPDVPTLNETILPGYEIGSWIGLFAPRDTPTEMVDALSAAAREVLSDPEVVAQFQQQGLIATPTTSEEAKEFFLSEVTRWKPIIEGAGIEQQ